MIIRFLILAAAFALMPIIPGVKLKGLGTAFGAALVFVLINFFFGWFFKVVLVLGTFGLAFLALNFLTNLAVLWATDKAMDDFEIKGFGSLFLATLLMTLANAVGTYFFVSQ
jgi:putative membrane protein